MYWVFDTTREGRSWGWYWQHAGRDKSELDRSEIDSSEVDSVKVRNDEDGNKVDTISKSKNLFKFKKSSKSKEMVGFSDFFYTQS